MRTTSLEASVRLYFLDRESEGGAAVTLMYGTLAQAMARAAQEPDEIQQGLYLATDNDVVAWLDLAQS